MNEILNDDDVAIPELQEDELPPDPPDADLSRCSETP